MGNSGKNKNNRKSHHRFSGRRDEAQKQDRKKQSESFHSDVKPEKPRANQQDWPRWTAPVLPANPITTPNCIWCGKKITDITTAISDKKTGSPVHFDCVIAKITEMETPETNDSICYIGGGRFGIIHYNNPPDTRDFTIKKILEWELKDNSGEWRRPISEYFSLT